jgi:hypothetical protein
MVDARTNISGTLAYPDVAAGAARFPASILVYSPAIVFYVLVMYFTSAFFMGDTGHYADVIAGTSIDSVLADFGHLLWLTAAWLVWNAIHAFAGAEDARGRFIVALIAISWTAGLIATVVVYDLALRVGRNLWVATYVAAAFVFSQGFLNFAHTGCAYVTGLALLLVGLWLLLRDEDQATPSRVRAAGAGVVLACSVATWFPYILALPGILAAPLLLFGRTGRRWRLVTHATGACAIVGVIVYGSAAAAQGIYDLSSFMQWMSASSHGITTGGFTRMVFGFARSFLNMGNDGVLFKRFVLHDPFNPVSLSELVRTSLGKFFGFYIFLAIILTAMTRTARGRRSLSVVAFCGVPVIAFAWAWQGGDMERYFPLYPAMFLSLADVLSNGPWILLVRSAAGVFLLLLLFSNGPALSKDTVERKQASALTRIAEIERSWKPHSEIATVLAQDDVFAFYWNYPLHPLSLTGFMAQRPDQVPVVFDIVNRNSLGAARWRTTFATEAATVWSRGGDLWVSKEAFEPRPRRDSAWVEGDDPTVPWGDVHQFFSKLQTGRSTGGENGFFLLPPSPANRERLAAAAREK